MLIDPKVKSIVIFNGGGGIVEREMKLTVQQGINEFQIQNVPASFDYWEKINGRYLIEIIRRRSYSVIIFDEIECFITWAKNSHYLLKIT